MAKQADEEKKYASYLLHNRKHQMGFNFVLFLVYSAFVIVLFHNLNTGSHWTVNIAPVLLFALPVIGFPMIQTWEYKPWQSKAQKYERHYRD